MITQKQLSSELSQYFSKLGKKGGEVNKKKGSDYFKWVRSHAKKKNPIINDTETK